MYKAKTIFLNAVPIAVMLALIPLIASDYALAGLYGVIILAAFVIRHEPKDAIAFIFGLIVMIVSEYFFIKTGVEVFTRRSLLGVMPLWLPLLWAYSFVAIKRTLIKIVDIV